jgi:hypothetical protein
MPEGIVGPGLPGTNTFDELIEEGAVFYICYKSA